MRRLSCGTLSPKARELKGLHELKETLMKNGSMYGHKGMAGAYGGKGGKKAGGRNPLKGKKMARGPKDVTPSLKGYVA